MRVAGTFARRWDAVAVVGLVGWLAFDLTARTLFGSTPWPQSAVDYRILYDDGRHVVQTHEYPAGYPYPPPAVAIHAASAAFPFATSAAIWLALTGLAALASYAALAGTLGLHRRPGALLLLPLAHLVVAYYFQWDMRSINCNLIVLAAVLFGCSALAKGADVRAGFWFALAVALKVLPVLLVPYLAWTRRWRAFASALAFSLVLWAGVPLAAFGTEGFAKVYAGWGGELTRATDPAAKLAHPILISLDKAALYATDQNPLAAKFVMAGVCVLWVGVGLAGAVASRLAAPRDGLAVLAHASLLVLGPAAVNPYLEPYHLVPLAVPSVLLLAVAADSHRPGWARLLAAVGFVAGLLILKFSSPWPLRGLLVNAQALALCGTAVAVAWSKCETPTESAGLEVQKPFWKRLFAHKSLPTAR
jgi:hypothetical protein